MKQSIIIIGVAAAAVGCVAIVSFYILNNIAITTIGLSFQTGYMTGVNDTNSQVASQLKQFEEKIIQDGKGTLGNTELVPSNLCIKE